MVALDFQKAIISSVFECVDKVGADLVAHTYHNLVQQYSSIIWVFVAVYVGFVFIQAIQGQRTFYDMLNTLFRIIIILTLALNYHYFCLFIYDIFTKEPLMIMKSITINGNDPNVISINQALDNFLNLGLKYTNKLFMMGGWSNLTYSIFGVLVLMMTVLCSILAASLIILSKCALVILLALSPMFITFALFEMTRGIFEAYIKHLFTYALVPILVSAVLMILLSVTDVVTGFMDQFQKISFTSIAPFLFICGVQIYLLSQVFSKASALGAGFKLGGLVSTVQQAKASAGSITHAALGGALGKKILKTAGQFAASRAYQGAANLASRMNRFRK